MDADGASLGMGGLRGYAVMDMGMGVMDMETTDMEGMAGMKKAMRKNFGLWPRWR